MQTDQVEKTLKKVAVKLVKNAVENAKSVAKLMNSKTVNDEHLKLVNEIQKSMKGSVQKAGRIVLPMRYFGVDDTMNYYPKEVVTPFETKMSNINLAETSRPGIDVKMLGGSKLVKEELKKYKNVDFSEEGIQNIDKSVKYNLSKVLKRIQSNGSQVTPNAIKNVINSSNSFKHLK